MNKQATKNYREFFEVKKYSFFKLLIFLGLSILSTTGIFAEEGNREGVYTLGEIVISGDIAFTRVSSLEKMIAIGKERAISMN